MPSSAGRFAIPVRRSIVAASCVAASVSPSWATARASRPSTRLPCTGTRVESSPAARRSAALTTGITRPRIQMLATAAVTLPPRTAATRIEARSTPLSVAWPPGPTRRTRVRKANGASSPSPPSARITLPRYAPRTGEWPVPKVPLNAPEVPARSRAGTPGLRAPDAGWYTPRVPTPWAVPPPEVFSDWPRQASRSRHEPSGPELYRAPRARCRPSGAVYPAGPRRACRGPFLLPAERERRRGATMPATVIVGLQWGDEGKGKATDFLSEQVRWVVRYQGGDNAGHTIVLGTEVFKLHLVPSGVLYPPIVPLIGPGVVVNPATLIGELDGLAARGVAACRVRAQLGCPPPRADRRHHDAGPGRAPGRRPRAVRGGPGDAPGPGSWVVPVRDVVQPGRRRRLHRRRDRASAGHRGDRDHEGLYDAGGRRPVSHRAPRRDRRGDRHPRPRVRHDDRPASPRRVVRRRAASLCGRRQQRQQHHPQQAGHPVGDRRDPPLRGIRDRRPARRALARLGRGSGPRGTDLRDVPRLAGGDPRGPHARRSPPQRACLCRRARRPRRRPSA